MLTLCILLSYIKKMIATKLKPCKYHGKDCIIYKRVDGAGYCKYGYFKTFPPKQINKVSEKRKEENKNYSELRFIFLTNNPYCKVKKTGCTKVATQVHHKKGRIGQLLTDVAHFLPICDNCHRWVELNPEEAKKLGYSLNRL